MSNANVDGGSSMRHSVDVAQRAGAVAAAGRGAPQTIGDMAEFICAKDLFIAAMDGKGPATDGPGPVSTAIKSDPCFSADPARRFDTL